MTRSTAFCGSHVTMFDVIASICCETAKFIHSWIPHLKWKRLQLHTCHAVKPVLVGFGGIQWRNWINRKKQTLFYADNWKRWSSLVVYDLRKSPGGRGCNWRGQECEPITPGKSNIKMGTHLVYILVFVWFSVGSCFWGVHGVFSGDFEF